MDAKLTLRAGQLAVLDAPSGSGSSYLLAVLAGLVRPASGQVLLDGQPFDAPDRRIALLPQEHHLAPELTAAEIVSLPLRAARRGPRGKDGPDLRAVPQRWLDAVGLTAAANHPVAQLSGGQRQRVALARCFASGAPLLLLDDPTAELDPANRTVVVDLVVEHIAAGGSALAASHDPELIERSDQQLIIVERQLRPWNPDAATGDLQP